MKTGNIILFAALSCVFAVVFCACKTANSPLDGEGFAHQLLLHLTFDEGKGNIVKDQARRLGDAVVNYVLTDPLYQESGHDPAWNNNGAVGGSLLFDGYSNYIKYSPQQIKVSGAAFSVSAWVAPRSFEWDDPNAAKNGSEHLTAIASQFSTNGKSGFLLGYQRHGALSFQVGTGGAFTKVWGWNLDRLEKYQWNLVTGVFDGNAGKAKLYLNGKQIGEANIASGSRITGTNVDLLIARNNEGQQYSPELPYRLHAGLLDDIRLYEAALPDDYIQSLYAQGTENGMTKEVAFEDIWLHNVLTGDYHRPQYHAGPYEHWMNEPHAPMYYNGKYHLFYQFNMQGPYWANICWGHWVSDDMVKWKQVKESITPDYGSVAPDGIWSGGVTYDDKGVPALFFTAGNDSRKDVNGTSMVSNQNIGMARPKDPSDPDLTEWVMHDSLIIKQDARIGRPGDFRDPHIWKEGSTCYMVIGSGTGTGGCALLYTAEDSDLANWTYRGIFHEVVNRPNQPPKYGEVWELPVVLPVKNRAGTIEKYVLMVLPSGKGADVQIWFYLGRFNKTTMKFESDFAEPKLLDYGAKVFSGQSAFIDPVKQRRVVFSIMQGQRNSYDEGISGWAHTAGMAREIFLSDDGSDLMIQAIDDYKTLHGQKLLELEDQTLAASNAALKTIKGDMVHIKLTVKNNSASKFGLRVRKNPSGTEYVKLYCSPGGNSIGVDTNRAGQVKVKADSSGPFTFKSDKTTVIDVYADRSLIEAYVDSGRALTARTYPANLDSTGIELFAEGGDITVSRLEVYTMLSIF
jgi:beta-fructofuranosidase